MNRNTKILALADFAVARGDYRRGSKNYENYVASLMELSTDEIDRRYAQEYASEIEREKTKNSKPIETEKMAEWRRNNSKVVTLRLMHKGDADIIAALEGKQATQEIRRLLRLGIAADQAKEDGTQ